MEEGEKCPSSSPSPSQTARTREEVLAQRAERKKLKDGRKNKGINPGRTGGSKNVSQKVNAPRSGSQQQSSLPPPKQLKSTTIPNSPSSTNKQWTISQGEYVTTPIQFHSTIHPLFRSFLKGVNAPPNKLHPAFHNFAVKLRHNAIWGSNHKTVSLLQSVKQLVQLYQDQVPSSTSFQQFFSRELQLNMDHLRRKCRLTGGIDNAIEFLMTSLQELPDDHHDAQHKGEFMELIDQYIEENIERAVEAIVLYGLEKIAAGNVIMVYSMTEALMELLVKAAENGTEGRFEIIFVQVPGNKLEIPQLLKRLDEPIQKQSITMSTINFSSAIHRIPHCSKIFIGGHALFTNGGVLAQVGSGELALMAASFNKPAIFLCETYKFCDTSPVDFFTLDECLPEESLDNEDGILEPKIRFDVTPANLVTVVITDIDMLPATSVPVVLRVQEGRSSRKQAGQQGKAVNLKQ